MSLSPRRRYEIFRRDGFSCYYCGRRAPKVTLEVDHRIPRCRGGSDDPDNLVSACWDCNRGKGPLDDRDYPPETFDEWVHEITGEAQSADFSPELPYWLLPERELRPIRFDFDVYAVMAELPKAEMVLDYTEEAVWRRAEAFAWPI